MSRPINLAVIVASNREGRFAPNVSRWFGGLVEARDDFSLDVIDLAEVELPNALGEITPALRDYRERLDRADAFVVITPEYNHGYPGQLKQAIDLAKREWFAKPVAFVSYGGMSGGLRAVEQLRLVFAELHATTIRDLVSLHNPWGMFDDAGELPDDSPANAAAQLMLDRLSWWSRALSSAREAEAYAA